VVSLLACLGTGCLRWESQQETLDQYIQAVQDRDAEICYRLMAPGLRGSIAAAVGADGDELDRFRTGFEALHLRFETDRESGQLVFTPDGIALIRALAMGKGAFYRPDQSLSRTRGGHATLIVSIVLPYNLIDRPDLARPGTVFWRLGRPFGRIYPVLHALPYVGDREELLRIRLRADLEVCEDDVAGSPTGWCLLSLQAMPETAEFQTVRTSSGLF
jgi:hypothetical protein